MKRFKTKATIHTATELSTSKDILSSIFIKEQTILNDTFYDRKDISSSFFNLVECLLENSNFRCIFNIR